MNNAAQTVTVNLSGHKHSYDIEIGSGIIKHMAEHLPERAPKSIYIITDSAVKGLYLDSILEQIREIYPEISTSSYAFEAGEKSKNLDTVHIIYQDMAKSGVDRSSLIINLGGGVVTDLGGFVAATFMRGVPCINISTTLEGMVDASVGGKTGVNLGHLKNYVGAFAQPQKVIIDVNTLKTLPDRVLLQGYAEVIKHGLIADSAFFHQAVIQSPLRMSSESLVNIIKKSITIKAHIVQEDELEKSARKLLNFGHTIGHVFESHSFDTPSPLYHGEAVAIGMIAESYISQAAGMISPKEFAQIEHGIESVGLPTRYTRTFMVEEVIHALKADKKNEGGKVKWTLLMGIGVGEYNISISEKFVRDAIEYVLS